MQPDKRRMLEIMQDACRVCGMCELGWTKHKRDSTELCAQVPGYFDGMSTTPRIMIVGQNPGWTEVREGRPFVGPAGKEFDKALDEYGGRYSIDRNKFYITNVVKCYTTDNRQPLQRHIDLCEPFLRMEITIIKPKFIVALGAVAFAALCPGINFSDSLGKIITSQKYGVKVFPTYHPSPLNLEDKLRRDQFNHDMRILCELLFRLESPF